MVHMPLRVPGLILQRAPADLEQPHCHPRPNLRQLDALISRAHEYVMPHLDAILNVLERHHAVPDLLI